MEQNFEHGALEKDIERLATEIREKKPSTEQAAKEAVSTAVKEVYHPQAGIMPQSSSVSGSLPGYMDEMPAETKLEVEKILDVTWHKGVVAGFKAAQKKSPLILDAFHDALVDKLYGELKKRGHVK